VAVGGDRRLEVHVVELDRPAPQVGEGLLGHRADRHPRVLDPLPANRGRIARHPDVAQQAVEVVVEDPGDRVRRPAVVRERRDEERLVLELVGRDPGVDERGPADRPGPDRLGDPRCPDAVGRRARLVVERRRCGRGKGA
jgi:hypothetical protein